MMVAFLGVCGGRWRFGGFSKGARGLMRESFEPSKAQGVGFGVGTFGFFKVLMAGFGAKVGGDSPPYRAALQI